LLEIIEAEMRVAMALTGVTKIPEIDGSILAGDGLTQKLT
jgi:isopentenyl diphosphate isomerase/L-lactate dehydrogenase-like FMN-dependent dehydrogenase